MSEKKERFPGFFKGRDRHVVSRYFGIKKAVAELIVTRYIGGSKTETADRIVKLSRWRRSTSYISCPNRRDKGHCARFWRPRAPPVAPAGIRRCPPCVPAPVRAFSCAGT